MSVLKRALVRLGSFTTLLMLWASVVQAQNAAWVNPAGGFYEEASNWVPSVVPGASNDVLINVGTAYNIGFLSDQTANSLSISNNLDLTFSSGGPGGTEQTYSLVGDATIDRASLTLGAFPQGQLLNVDIDGKLNMEGANLSLLNGAQLSSLLSLASSNEIDGFGGASSQIAVRGTNGAGQSSRWESGGGIIIGRDGGPASLSIAEGGQVSTTDTVSIGAAVGADGSSVDVLGTSADGTPSSLTSGFFQLGFLSGGGGLSVATAQVADGAHASTGGVQVFLNSRLGVDREDLNRNPSRWDAGTFDVFGGFVDVLRGGHITSDSLTLTRLAIAKVNGVGAGGRPSRWDINGNLRLGNDQGFGSLLIDSGHVTSATAQIGVGTGSSLLSVDGIQNAIGVWENSGDVYVGGSNSGPEASGDLRINDEHSRGDIGGTLTVWGPGTVRINSGEFEVDVVDHTHGGAFEFNAGTLRVNRFDGDLLNPAGTLAPGVDSDTAATLIDGNYTQQSGGTLALDIGGTGPGSTHDLVTITGDAQIDGLLELSLVNGFAPNAAAEFTVLAAGSLIGFFDNVNTGQRLGTLDGGGSFAVHYGIGSAFDENRIILSDFLAAPTIPGDYNNDGTVNAADYAVWRDALGTSVTLPGDATPGSVTQADYDVWRNNFGAAAAIGTATTTTAAIPEPASLMLLGWGGVWALGRRRHA